MSAIISEMTQTMNIYKKSPMATVLCQAFLLFSHNFDYTSSWNVLLYISGNETKDASKVHLSTVAWKPEETFKQGQGRLLCEPETPG